MGKTISKTEIIKWWNLNHPKYAWNISQKTQKVYENLESGKNMYLQMFSQSSIYVDSLGHLGRTVSSTTSLTTCTLRCWWLQPNVPWPLRNLRRTERTVWFYWLTFSVCTYDITWYIYIYIFVISNTGKPVESEGWKQVPFIKKNTLYIRVYIYYLPT